MVKMPGLKQRIEKLEEIDKTIAKIKKDKDELCFLFGAKSMGIVKTECDCALCKMVDRKLLKALDSKEGKPIRRSG